MWISTHAIKKPIVTAVAMVALVVFGGIALLRLDRDEFPNVTAPIVNVSVVYPGASPAIVERELVDPLEEAFRSIAGVDLVASTSVDGYANITVVFAFQKDLQQGMQDLRDKISASRADLPPEMEEPILTRLSTDYPILSLALTSDTQALVALTQLAQGRVHRALAALPGVAGVAVTRWVERRLTIE